MSKFTVSYFKLFCFTILVSFVFYPFLSHKAFAAGWQKYSGNPVFSPATTSSWDSTHVHNPSVLKISNTYTMWYDGAGSSSWRIGYSSSQNESSGWSRNSQPIISPDPTSSWEKEVGDPFVIYNPTSSTYQIWFTSINSDHWLYGTDRFRTKYATSINGINWTDGSWVLTGTTGSWDEGGTSRGRSVILRDGVYHMWYSATNSDNLANNPYWRIGHATSTDGINWLKENQGNPINIQGESLTLNTSYPTVILSNGIYHMWYSIATNDGQDQINYAYSVDGTTWLKPNDQSLGLTRSSGTFDQNNIAPYSVLVENDVLKLWYSGLGSDGHWRIGYATASASFLFNPNPTDTPTPTPTPTSTPTPTPTPIPTPTPTPGAPTKKVIIIPGMTASWNLDALANCKADNYRGRWTLPTAAQKVYNPLVTSLSKDGWQVNVFPYDWRKQIPDNVASLKSFINTTSGPGEKIDIVGHSMGGLLGRAYLEQEKNNMKLEKLMTVGSPHQGAPLAYPSWSGGEIPKGDPAWRFMLTMLVKRCTAKTHDKRLAIHEYFPALQNVLPTFDYLTDDATGLTKPVSAMHAQNNWLPTQFAAPFFGVTVGTLAGTGQSTVTGFRVTDPSSQEAAAGYWIDGKPVQSITAQSGDGSVLTSSAALLAADNRTIVGNHSGIISSNQGISQIKDFLTNSSGRASTTEEVPASTSTLYVVGYGADFWLIDSSGRILKPTDGLISLSNPTSQRFALVTIPTASQTLIIVSQEFGEKFFYKEYTFNDYLPKIRFLDFNSNTPKEDILQ